jgi:GAF domain-containing protein
LALDNLKADPTMAAISSLNKSISFNAIIVCPIRIGNEVWGVLSVRLPESKKSLSDFEIRFVQLTANVIGGVIARQPSFLRAA